MTITAGIAGENITQKWARNGGFDSFGTGAAYAGYAFASGGSNYVTCVRIRMPGAGISAQFKIAYSHDAGTDSAKKIRWKITKSPADSTYENAGVSVAGDGECAILSGSGHFTVNYRGSFSAGEYLYLYLWTGAGEDVYTLVTIAAAGSHVCSYTEGTASSVSVSGQYLGSPVTIRISRNNSSFTHTLTYSFEGHTGTIAAGVGTAYTWTPELSVFGPYIPNAVSGVCTVSCTTYNGSVQVGSAALAQVTLSMPAGCVPAVSNGWIASVTAQNAGTAAAAFSSFVQGYSRVKVAFDSGKITQSYGASLASLKVTFQGTAVTASGAVAVTGTAVNAGTAVLRCTCTDSRGRSVSEDVAITVLSYAKPSLSEVTVFRADSGGNADEEGAWIYAKAKVTWSPLDGANGCSMSGSWKTGGGAYGSAVQMTSGVSVLMGGALSATATYTAKITASDSLGNGVSLEKVIPTASCAFHIREGGRGAAFFGYSEKDGELSLSGKKITGVGAPTEAGDALPKGYTVPISEGGTGATSRLAAAKALTNQAVSSPGFVVGLTSGWGSFGYTTIAQLRTALGINDYVTAQGTSGEWYYRKWNSGRAECYWYGWITPSVSASAGKLLNKVYMYAKSYPFTFAATPTAVAGVTHDNGYGFVTRLNIDKDKVSVLWEGGTNNASAGLSIHVTGKWK